MVLGIERNSPDALELIVELLSRLYRAGIVTKDQMQQVGGVERRGEGEGGGEGCWWKLPATVSSQS